MKERTRERERERERDTQEKDEEEEEEGLCCGDCFRAREPERGKQGQAGSSAAGLFLLKVLVGRTPGRRRAEADSLGEYGGEGVTHNAVNTASGCAGAAHRRWDDNRAETTDHEQRRP